MKRFTFILYTMILSSTVFAADQFICKTKPNSKNRAYISGQLESWTESKNLLSYQLEINAGCEGGFECKSKHLSQAKMLMNRLEYNPTKYFEYQQFILPTSVKLRSRQRLEMLQLILPKKLSPEFSAILINTRENNRYKVRFDMDCKITASVDTDFGKNLDLSQTINRAVSLIHEDFGFKNVDFAVDEVALAKQLKENNPVSFLKALKSALINFLNDEDHPESPLALARIGAYENWNLSNVKESLLDHHISHWYLIESLLSGPANLEFSYDPYPPEEGESGAENWIFRLQIEQLSDHIYWSIVSKDGSKKTYNYGFN